jgi:hypothetical protein
MTTFDKREEAFERQFVHDEGVRFKALARRNKRLGLWAAERLGRTGSSSSSPNISRIGELPISARPSAARKRRPSRR